MQFHMLTDSHEQMSSLLSSCKETCASYGHAFPRSFFTDDPYRDKNFFITIFPHL